MYDPVYRGSSHHWVSEDLLPLREDKVRSDAHTRTVVGSTVSAIFDEELTRKERIRRPGFCFLVMIDEMCQ